MNPDHAMQVAEALEVLGGISHIYVHGIRVVPDEKWLVGTLFEELEQVYGSQIALCRVLEMVPGCSGEVSVLEAATRALRSYKAGQQR
jgi:hypothetical protein